MDGNRFDALARAFARRAHSRRTLIARAGAVIAALTARPALAGNTTAPKQDDLVAMLLQPSDPVLGGKPWVFVDSAFGGYPHIGAFPPALDTAVKSNGGLLSAASSAVATLGSNGKPNALIVTYVLFCKDAPSATSIFDAYRAAILPAIQPLDASLLGESGDAFFGIVSKPDDPVFLSELPNSPAFATFYREDAVVAGTFISGSDQAFAAGVGKRMIAAAQGKSVFGAGLANRLVFAETNGPVDAWYSRIDKHEQWFYNLTKDQLAAQKTAEGDATDFARTSQYFPTPETDTLFHLNTWAANFPSHRHAQRWLDGLEPRLTAQSPGVRLVKINEADGLGDASAGFLYMNSVNGAMALGVDLYARSGGMVFATGLNVFAGSATPGFSALMSDPRPLGAGAQTVLEAQLAPPPPVFFGPRPVPLNDIFGGSPLQPSPAVENAGTTSKETFHGCAPSCNKPAKDDQHTPYVVWCQPSSACTDAKCTCNLFRTKKKSTTAEWFGGQNEKKEYDPDNYTYSCLCGTVASS